MNSQFHQKWRCFEEAIVRPPDPLNPATQSVVFEKSLAEFFNVKEAIVVSSGTAAIHCALGILDIGPGDEVLVPSLSVVMSVAPVLYQGAKPVFVDCQSHSIDFDYEDLRRKLSPMTKAILPVYLWGCSYDMNRLMSFATDNNLIVVEDACQAHGSVWGDRYLGTWGAIGCFSMRSGKLISTGEGGFLLTNDVRLAKLARAFRSHWANTSNPSDGHHRIGWNYRLSEVQAMLGQSQLNQFPHSLAYRQWQSEYVVRGLKDVSQLEAYNYSFEERSNQFSPLLLVDGTHASRSLAVKLSQEGVANSVGSFGLRPVQEWPIFEKHSSLLKTNNASSFLSRILAILLLPTYGESELDSIVETVKKILHRA